MRLYAFIYIRFAFWHYSFISVIIDLTIAQGEHYSCSKREINKYRQREDGPTACESLLYAMGLAL